MKTKITLLCLLMSGLAYADPSPSSTNQTLYSGYSLPFPGSAPEQVPPASLDSVLPYGMITAQDIFPLMTGYSLMNLKPALGVAGSYDGAFVANPVSNTQPVFSVSDPAELTVGSLLASISKSHINDYYSSQPKVFPSFSDLQKVQGASGVNNSAASYAGANIGQTTNVYQMDTGAFAAPYNAASLFQYMAPAQLQKSPFAANFLAYQQNPGEVYIALASGGLTPPSTGEGASPEYQAQMRRIAALQTAGVYALQEIFARSVPLKSDNPLVQSLQGYPGEDKMPQNERSLEKFMATRRIDPNSGWYQHVQQASPVELQREQLYLQAEMLYELQKVHETEERNELLLAASLLSRNYESRLWMNQFNDAQVAVAAQSGASPGKPKANTQNTAANFAKQMNLGG